MKTCGHSPSSRKCQMRSSNSYKLNNNKLHAVIFHNSLREMKSFLQLSIQTSFNDRKTAFARLSLYSTEQESAWQRYSEECSKTTFVSDKFTPGLVSSMHRKFSESNPFAIIESFLDSIKLQKAKIQDENNSDRVILFTLAFQMPLSFHTHHKSFLQHFNPAEKNSHR